MWIAKAPSNIALIKYMGKKDGNIATNISLSYTLEKFTTEVILELNKHPKDQFINNNFNQQEIERFLAHLSYIKHITKFDRYFMIKSKNNFPRSAGIASSASSFAALTICAFKCISEITKSSIPTAETMSNISRTASGSSCRSFFSPWCVWNGLVTEKIDLPILQHDLILVDDQQKKISSSAAHKLIQTSLLIDRRKERAEIRFYRLKAALNSNNWKEAYQTCWEEFFDMHALFETSCPNFGYITAKTMAILIEIREFWENNNDGPIITIDAGPNIHLLWRNNSEDIRSELKKQLLKNFRNAKLKFL